MTAIPLTIREPAGVARPGELVTLSVPLPHGLARASDRWSAIAPGGHRLPCQTRELAAWPDGSVRWLSATFAATVAAWESVEYRLVRELDAAGSSEVPLCLNESRDVVEIQCGDCRLRLPRTGDRLIESVSASGSALSVAQLRLVDDRGRNGAGSVDSLEVAESGPLLARLAFKGRIGKAGLKFCGQWIFRAGTPCVQLELTIHNPSRARHPRGLWDLGDPGSVLFRSLHVEITLPEANPQQIQSREQLADDWRQQAGGQFEIAERTGKGPRATPLVALTAGDSRAAAGIAEFWQQFPKSLEAQGNKLRIGLFPTLGHDQHELQGGEQKTTRIAVQVSPPAPDAAELLAVLTPLEAACDPAWIASTRAFWRLPRTADGLAADWHKVAHQAVAGEHNFFAKRETANEYGWRNFGDLWADHEEAYYNGPRPIVSHYNNQYDPLEAFLLCYLMTGDRRWWELADPLARHVIDIDIYHTTQDRAAYNGGLFWHTNHYLDAATSTHRSYSRVNHPGGGGGPANEHNYTSGLLLYYYLTGNVQARDAVVGLAEWVLHMDDGRRHVLGLVHEAPTGMASKTTESTYHSPGRGAGNSINALLDGWLASGRREFLAKIDELVRRTIHPHDDIPALDLGNAELRWSYTVFLQSLVRLLAMSEEWGLDADLAAYARASLLHYARWMAEHERFYLDEPQKLEYPTETWAAQELRKANVLTAATVYADEHDASRFRAKAQWIYDRAWSSLMGFPTWHYTRPMVLALQMGLYAAQFAGMAAAKNNSSPQVPVSLSPRRERFVPQREAVRQGLRSPAQLMAMTARLARVWRWPEVWRVTWTRQRLQRYWGQFIG